MSFCWVTSLHSVQSFTSILKVSFCYLFTDDCELWHLSGHVSFTVEFLGRFHLCQVKFSLNAIFLVLFPLIGSEVAHLRMYIHCSMTCGLLIRVSWCANLILGKLWRWCLSVWGLDALRIIVAGRVYLVAVDMFVHSAGSPSSANAASGLKQRSQHYSLMPPCANPLRRRVVNSSDGTKKPHFYIFWRKRDRVRKIRVRKLDRITRKYGNKPIRTLSRKE